MEMTNLQFCQSCAMPLQSDEMRGTEADGAKSADYCVYCYKDGKFLADCTMEQMIDFCVPHMEGMTEEAARAMMNESFPQLKRWQSK